MLHQLISYLLALLVLLSTTGVTVNRHYCRSELKHTTLYQEPASCHEDTAFECPFHCQAKEKQDKDCCNNKSSFHKLEVVNHIDLDEELAFDFPNFDWIAQTESLWRNKFWLQAVFSPTHYQPPSIIRAIFRLIQCFRC